jgi:mRNA interferase RelE/StbE
MTWTVLYHEAVVDDLNALGPADARQILRVITQRLQYGEPDKAGKPLAGRLVGCRRIRTGDKRIIFRVDRQTIEVLVIAVGHRRNSVVYEKAETCL